MTVIGIDLGTTNSCVSVFAKGRIEVFENDHGSRTTPSYVAFTDVDFIVGNEAKIHTTVDPRNTVFDAKRLIGRKYSDEFVQKDKQHWPFAVENENGKPTIRVSYLKKEKRLIPEEVSAMILRRMKEIAEEKLNEKVTRAVITVPAYFNDSQRQATKEAAIIAGLNVTRLINEPTAAAIAFALNKKGERKSNVLVYDLGGGTFDVSVLTVDNGNIEVKAVNGDTHLGGSDFDAKVLEYFLDEIKRKHQRDLRIPKYTRSISRLRQACEGVKIALSAKRRLQASIEVDALFDGIDFRSEISRAKFDELCDDLMRQTLTPVENALNDAKLKKNDIDDILLVGGSTRILKIQSLVQEFFDGKALNRSINPEEAVACGAAVQAALLQGEKDEVIAGINLKDVTALSYGVGIKGGLMSVIIPRNTPYPTKKTEGYQTVSDNQTEVAINVYQGERELVKDNHFLGTFTINGLPPKWKGEVKLDETIEIDDNGILVVTALERSTGASANITISNAMERLSDEKINRLISEAEKMKIADSEYKERIIAKNELESCLYDLKHSVNEDYTRVKCGTKTKNRVKAIVDETSHWMEDNPDASKEVLDLKLTILRRQQRLLTTSNQVCKTS